MSQLWPGSSALAGLIMCSVLLPCFILSCNSHLFFFPDPPIKRNHNNWSGLWFCSPVAGCVVYVTLVFLSNFYDTSHGQILFSVRSVGNVPLISLGADLATMHLYFKDSNKSLVPIIGVKPTWGERSERGGNAKKCFWMSESIKILLYLNYWFHGIILIHGAS